MVALQDDLTGWGELVFRERQLVRWVGDLVLLGRNGLCGCMLQRGMGILEVGKLFMEGGEHSSGSAEVGNQFSLHECLHG